MATLQTLLGAWTRARFCGMGYITYISLLPLFPKNPILFVMRDYKTQKQALRPHERYVVAHLLMFLLLIAFFSFRESDSSSEGVMASTHTSARLIAKK